MASAGSRREANAARNMVFLRGLLPRRLRVSPAREVPDWRVTGTRPAQAASLLPWAEAEPSPISAVHRATAALVGVDPVAERAFIAAQVPGHLRDRLAGLPHQPHHALPEVRIELPAGFCYRRLLKAMSARYEGNPPGSGTGTASSRKSGMARSRSGGPPLACGPHLAAARGSAPGRAGPPAVEPAEGLWSRGRVPEVTALQVFRPLRSAFRSGDLMRRG